MGVEVRENKNMPDVYRVRHRSKWHENKSFTLAVFYSKLDAERFYAEFKLKLKYDKDGSVLNQYIEKAKEDERGRVFLHEFFDDYVVSQKKHQASTRGHLKEIIIALAKVLNKKPTDDIYLDDLIKKYNEIFAVFEKENKRKTTQVNRHCVVKRAFYHKYQNDYKPDEIFKYTVESKHLSKKYANEVHVDDRMLKKLLPHCNKRLVRALIIESQLGCRFGPVELQEIKYSDLIEEDGQHYIVITNAKRKIENGSDAPPFREVPASDVLVSFFKKWEAEDRTKKITTDYIINWGNKKCVALNNAWGRAKKLAGVGDVQMRPYASRHEWANFLLDNGADPLAVAHMMGHKDTRMLDKVYGNRTRNRQLKTLPILQESKYTKTITESMSKAE